MRSVRGAHGDVYTIFAPLRILLHIVVVVCIHRSAGRAGAVAISLPSCASRALVAFIVVWPWERRFASSQGAPSHGRVFGHMIATTLIRRSPHMLGSSVGASRQSSLCEGAFVHRQLLAIDVQSCCRAHPRGASCGMLVWSCGRRQSSSAPPDKFSTPIRNPNVG